MSDLISREALCEYALNQKDKSITPNDIMRFPSAQPEKRTHERTETHGVCLDAIDRQAAIDALFELYEYQRDIDPTEAADLVRQGVYLAEKKIEQLPSAQPDSKETSSTHKALDTISRQAAIDAVCKAGCGSGYCGIPCDDVKAIEQLPSAQPEVLACGEGELIAQPEIIRCNDCKHWTQTTGNMRGFGLGDCDYINAKLVNCNGFCYWAERRTNEGD